MPAPSDNAARATRIAIVGGGPGGLFTAWFLEQQCATPISTTIFEASPRLGGKILTPTFDAARVQYEAGAAEFYDYSEHDEDPLKELIRSLGLIVRPMGGPAVIMGDKVLGNLDDLHDHLGPTAREALVLFDRMAKDQMTRQEFYHADSPEGMRAPPDPRRFDSMLATIEEPRTRAYVETLIHSDLATEPRKTSCGYGLQNYLMNAPGYMLLYGIEGGNELLPRELASRLAAQQRLQHRVTEVSRADDGSMCVSIEHDGTATNEHFDYVIVALPHNQLGSVHYAGDRLADAVQRHRDYYDHPAHYLRITILFEQPFWRRHVSDSYWMLDELGGCCLYDESSRDPSTSHGVLGWLLGGDAAEAMSGKTDEQLIEAALDSLPQFLQHGRDTFVEGKVHRWTAAVNAMPGGAVPRNFDRRHQPEPREHGNLFFVGDYMFDSTLNGVLDSAHYVASWIAGETAR